MKHPFESFLETFIPQVAAKSKQLNQAVWILETTGSIDAADLKASLNIELRLLFSCRQTYEKLLLWNEDLKLEDPLLKRQLNILIRTFTQNMLPPHLIAEISQKEAALCYTYTNFRPFIDGKPLSENEIKEVLKQEEEVEKRKKAWEASKEIGEVLAPQILELVRLRNQAAQSLGYSDYFQMELALQEVDPMWLSKTFEAFYRQTEKGYAETVERIEAEQCSRFKVNKEELGPWAWSDPFAQEDPIGTHLLDELVSRVDICEASKQFYLEMGCDVSPIFQKSDMYERAGKNQHAFCLHLDRSGDIRTLNNVKPTLKWLEVVLHEYGHAIYDLGYASNLPWLLKEPPHMILTEAMALLAGRQAYLSKSLTRLVGLSSENILTRKAEESLRRRQQIFSRWVLVMTAFEQELYKDPAQDLNVLWWKLVEKYQKIQAPKNRYSKCDWAAKYHIGLAPAYYYSYLLGEMFASALEETLEKETGSKALATKKAGRLLNEKLFSPGSSMNWTTLVKYVSGHPLTPEAWVKQFCESQT